MSTVYSHFGLKQTPPQANKHLQSSQMLTFHPGLICKLSLDTGTASEIPQQAKHFTFVNQGL